MLRFPYLRLIRFAPLIGVLCLALASYGRRIHPGQSASFGRFTSEKMMDMSLPLCEAIAPHEAAFTLYTERFSEPAALSRWTVFCTDEAGHEVADLTWDAATGRLLQVGAFPPYREDPTKALLTRREATHSAYTWLRTLQGNPPSAEWRLARPPVCVDRRSWEVLFQAAGHYARIQLQAHTGNLLTAAFWKVNQS